MIVRDRIEPALRRLWPRRTVRFRLTAIYGGLFFASAAAVLAVVDVLVGRASNGVYASTTNGSTTISLDVSPSAIARLSQSAGTALKVAPGGSAIGAGQVTSRPSGSLSGPTGFREQAQRLIVSTTQQHAAEVHDLLVYSGLALLLVGVIALALGWIMAGRVLRPLRTMTARVKDISATSLHERLAIDGPHDELSELAGTFDDLLGRLERSFRAQRQFVANASHELRTPLARQKALAQVALADPEATVDSLRSAHERVLRSGEQQERLIEALLTLTRGQSEIEQRQPVDLASVAAEVVASRRPDATEMGIDLHASLHPASTTGDTRLVERLVANLVDNAVRHNVSDGVISVVTRTRDGRGVVSVANSGVAISDADAARILQPFQRLEPERTGNGGLGLGLSIVAAIAEVHGADLHVRPRPGGGLEVDVVFAAVPQHVAAPGADGPASGTPGPPSTGRQSSLAVI